MDAFVQRSDGRPARSRATSSANGGMLAQGGSMWLKSLLVICSLVCCAGALFATLPSDQDLAEWRGVVARSVNDLARSAQSRARNAMPSSGDVVRHIQTARQRAQSFAATAFGGLLQPKAPSGPELGAPVATPECRLQELAA